MNTAVLDTIRASGRLPSPTQAAINIIRVARDPQASLAEVAAVVETDPASAARIIKYVNSPYFGVTNKVKSLKQAVTLLGTRSVLGLALGYSLVSKHRQGWCKQFDYDGFWSDSLARAVTVRHLSPKHGLLPHESFTCGLLSQIGRLALATVFPDVYAEILTDLQENPENNLAQMERDCFDTDHNELSAAMISEWSLPLYFSEAVRAQEDPEGGQLTPASRAKQLAVLLNLCENLEPFFAAQQLHERRLDFLMQSAYRALVRSDNFTETFEQIEQDWHEMGAVLEIQTQRNLPWDELRQQVDAVGWLEAPTAVY